MEFRIATSNTNTALVVLLVGLVIEVKAGPAPGSPSSSAALKVVTAGIANAADIRSDLGSALYVQTYGAMPVAQFVCAMDPSHLTSQLGVVIDIPQKDGKNQTALLIEGDTTMHGELHGLAMDVAGFKKFKIDHPLAPANKYLVHVSIESSEAKNLYD